MNENNELLTPEEVANRLHLRPNTVRGWIRVGRMPAVNISTRNRPIYRVRLSDLEQWLKQPERSAP